MYTTKYKIYDFMLLLISFFSVYFTLYNLIHSQVPDIFLLYGVLFSVLLFDRLTLRKLNNILFWKAVFVVGIIILFLKGISLLPLIFQVEADNFLDFWMSTLLIQLVIGTMLLFVYRSYLFIVKKL